MKVDKRLKRLESSARVINTDIEKIIESGVTYEDLTDEQKDIYCAYKGYDREAMETVNKMVLGTINAELKKNLPPMTPEQKAQHIKKVAAEIESILNAEPAERT